MTAKERKVLSLLGDAYNAFAALKTLHSADKPEFVAAIHAAQNIVLAREGLRTMRSKHKKV